MSALTTSIKPLPRLTLMAEDHAFWLADTHDSFYAVNGAPPRRHRTRRRAQATASTRAQSITSARNSISLRTYAISPIATLEAGYGHFFVGDYVKESLSAPAFGSTDANWVYLQLNVSF